MMQHIHFRIVANWLWLLIALLAATTPMVAQQTTADLVGTVQDPTGGLLVGAELSLVNTDTNIMRTVRSNEQGVFVFTGIQPGSYRLEAQQPGFKRARVDGIALQVAQRTRLDVVLDVGDVAESVEVQASAPLIDTESPTIGTVIGQEAILQLPLNGRDFSQLVSLTPGVVSTPEGYSGAGTPSPGNTVSLDGGSARDPFNGQTTLLPILDTIQEFKAQVSQYSAEYGNSGGLVIDVATRSGTNQFHGSLWEFHRNKSLDAPSFFSAINPVTGDKVKAPLIRNQFGFMVGGPIVRNRTFFLGAYEGLRLPASRTYTSRIPTAAEKSGDLSAYASFFNKTIVDPFTKEPLPNNVIPQSRIDPISRNILDNLFVDPNNPDSFRNWVIGQKAGNDQNNWTIRLDHMLSSNHSLFGRFSDNDQTQLNVGARSVGMALGYGDTEVFTRGRHAVGGLTSTFTPNLVNIFRYSYTRRDFASHIPSGALDGFGGCLGLGLQAPQCRQGTDLGGLPSFSLRKTGLSSSGGETFDFSAQPPSETLGEIHQFQNNLTWTHGSHTLKFGASVERQTATGLFDGWGSVTFAGNYTNDGFSDFLLGLPSGVAGRLDVATASDLSSWFFGPYIQDDWKVTPNLTLNFGLRYELATPVVEANGFPAQFNPRLGTGVPGQVQAGDCPNNPNFCGGLMYPKTNTTAAAFYAQYRPDLPFGFLDSDSTFDQDSNNWAPRIGIAWRPFGNTRTVIRTGYGIYYYFQPLLNISRFIGAIFPNNISVSVPGNATTPNLNYQTLPDRAGNLNLQNVLLETNTQVGGQWLNPYVQQWSFSLAQELSDRTVIEAQYSGNKSTHLFSVLEANHAEPSPEDVLPRMPYQKFGQLAGYYTTGFGSYNAGILSIKRQMSDGLSFNAGYTYAKAMGGGGGYVTNGAVTNYTQDPDNIGSYKYRSGEDVRHSLNGYILWNLPVGRGKRFGSNLSGAADKLLSSWQMSTIFVARTGLPFTMLVGKDACNASSGFAQRCYPNRLNPETDTEVLSNGVDSPKYLRENFPSPNFAFGNASPNILDQNGLWNIDWAMMKDTSFGERYRLEFRFEAFNVFNHPTFASGMTSSPENSQFGRVFSSGEPRRLQLGLKFHF